MNYRQIEQSKEIRLWLEHIVIPGIVVAGLLLSNKQLRNKIAGIFRGENYEMQL